MVYFDTNIYVYAFSQNVDNLQQKFLSQGLLKKHAANHELILSEIILYEFAFVSHKLGESKDTIQRNLSFLSRYVSVIDDTVHARTIELFDITGFYKNAFDVFHLAFSESKACRLITFDKGFNKLKEVAKVEIEVLS